MWMMVSMRPLPIVYPFSIVRDKWFIQFIRSLFVMQVPHTEITRDDVDADDDDNCAINLQMSFPVIIIQWKCGNQRKLQITWNDLFPGTDRWSCETVKLCSASKKSPLKKSELWVWNVDKNSPLINTWWSEKRVTTMYIVNVLPLMDCYTLYSKLSCGGQTDSHPEPGEKRTRESWWKLSIRHRSIHQVQQQQQWIGGGYCHSREHR